MLPHVTFHMTAFGAALLAILLVAMVGIWPDGEA